MSESPQRTPSKDAALDSFDVAKPPQWPIPAPLQTKVWLPMSIVFAGLAIALEVVFFYVKKNQGWAVTARSPADVQALEYAYRFPPVIIAMVVVAFWTNTAEEIKRMQPYIALAQGDSAPQHSVLVDYSRNNKFTVWRRAAQNGHYAVSIASLLSLLVLVFNPLASTLFVIGDIPVLQPITQTTSQARLGLNDDDPRFQDLTVFLTAAGFAGASVQYGLPDPPFVYDQWSVAPFSIPTQLSGNGTLTARTTAVKTDSNCVRATTLDTAPLPGGVGYTNNATAPLCTSTWDVDHNTPVEYEAFPAICEDQASVPADFHRVAFWFFTSQPRPLVASVFCAPVVELWNVTVTLDLATANLTSVTPLQQITTEASILGSPMNGRGLNGLTFEKIRLNFFGEQSQNATRIQLPAAVLQMATSSGNFSEDQIAQLTNRVYRSFLKTLAKAIYFVPDTATLTVETRTFEKRAWLNPPTVHAIAATLLVLSVCSAILHFTQRQKRRSVKIPHEPGSIASAVSLGAGTNLATLLAQGKNRSLEELLGGKTFSLDRSRIVVNNEREMP